MTWVFWSFLNYTPHSWFWVIVFAVLTGCHVPPPHPRMFQSPFHADVSSDAISSERTSLITLAKILILCLILIHSSSMHISLILWHFIHLLAPLFMISSLNPQPHTHTLISPASFTGEITLDSSSVWHIVGAVNMWWKNEWSKIKMQRKTLIMLARGISVRERVHKGQ